MKKSIEVECGVAEQKLFVSAPAPTFKSFSSGSDYTFFCGYFFTQLLNEKVRFS
jgi:hypothetical protein